MIRLLFLSGAVLFSVFLSAAPIAPPPRIKVAFTQEELKVAETGEFSSLEAPGVNNAVATPATSCAAKLARNNASFRWIPSPLTNGVGVASDLRGAALSPDESLLVLLERVGGANRPNSTRVLLFNLCNNRLIGGFTLPKVRLDTPFFLPGSDGMTIFALRREQKEFNTHSGIVLIDLKTGKIEDSADLQSEEIISAAVGGNRIFFSCSGKKEIGILDAEQLTAPIRTFKPEIKNPHVAASDKALLVFSGNQLQRFPLKNGKPQGLPDPETLSGVKEILSIQLLEPDGSMLLIFERSGTLWFRRGTSLRLLDSLASGFAAYSKNDRTIYAALKKKDLIQPYLLPELEPKKGSSPQKMRPATRGSLYALFPLCGKKQSAVAVDEQGAVYTIQFGDRRWRKTMVYQLESNNTRK